MSKPIFASRLSQALAEKEMTQAELSRRTNIHKATINQYVKGRYKAKPEGVYKIAAELGCNPMWLLGYEEEKDQNVPDSAYSNINITLPVLSGELDKYGSLLYNDIKSYMVCDQEYRDKAHFYIRMIDDSMAPLIGSGDILLCRMSRQLGDGDIGLFIIDRSKVWIRRFRESGNAVTLESANMYWPPQVFSEEERNRLTVEAKIISCTHKFE